jgi:hypothetical protein
VYREQLTAPPADAQDDRLTTRVSSVVRPGHHAVPRRPGQALEPGGREERAGLALG